MQESMLRIDEGSPQISHSTFRFSAGHGIYTTEGASATIEGCKFHDLDAHGIIMDPTTGGKIISCDFRDTNGYAIVFYNTLPELTDNTFGDDQKIGIVSGNITETGTLHFPGLLDNGNVAPYEVCGYGVSVGNDTSPITLTIEAGVEVQGTSLTTGPHRSVMIGKNAALKVLGTSDKPVVFTSPNEEKEKGDWTGVIIKADARGTDTSIEYAIFEYAGMQESMLRIDGGSPQISHSTFRFGAGYGIYTAQGASPHITYSKFLNNSNHGIHISDPGNNVKVNHCELKGNGDYGMYNENTDICVDAKYNDWGDPSGPLDDSEAEDCAGLYNPDGKGEKVSDGIIYSDWVGAAPDISVEPVSYDLSLSAGASTTKDLTLSNTGQVDLTYQVEEEIDWLTVNPISGTVAPGGSEKLTLTFDATALAAGTYQGQITITSNDPDEAAVAVQVKLTVIAEPQADIEVVVTSPQFVGQEFWVDIQVGKVGKPVKDLFGVSFVLNYTNTGIIDALQVESKTGQLVMGSNVVDYSDIDDPNGQVSVGISRKAGAGGFDGYGAVARVKFKFLPNAAEGQTVDLTLSDVLAKDPTGVPIVLAPVAGQVTVKAGFLVWPGDTDNNGGVDQGDILPIGCYWHSTGPARVQASSSWEAQVAPPWSPEAATYADADGSGTVDQGEILVIGQNWHKTHAGGVAKPTVDIFSIDHSRYLTQYRMMYDALKNSPETEGVTELRRILAQFIKLALPKEDRLGQNFPNPFNASTQIEYQLSNPNHVRLAVYDLLGQKVRTLVDEKRDAGSYTIVWDGKDNSGQAVGSGIYLYRMVKGDFVRAKRMLLLR